MCISRRLDGRWLVVESSRIKVVEKNFAKSKNTCGGRETIGSHPDYHFVKQCKIYKILTERQSEFYLETRLSRNQKKPLS